MIFEKRMFVKIFISIIIISFFACKNQSNKPKLQPDIDTLGYSIEHDKINIELERLANQLIIKENALKQFSEEVNILDTTLNKKDSLRLENLCKEIESLELKYKKINENKLKIELKRLGMQ